MYLLRAVGLRQLMLPGTILRCAHCQSRAANPCLVSSRNAKARFCTFACLAAYDARREEPEIEVERVWGLRKVKSLEGSG